MTFSTTDPDHPGRTARAVADLPLQTTVVVRGELDLATVPAVRDRLAEALRPCPARLVLDLSGCDFADCQAITLLLQARAQAGRQGTDLVLHRPSGAVRRLLELTRLTVLLAVDRTGPA